MKIHKRVSRSLELAALAFCFSSASHAADCKDLPKWFTVKEVTFQVVAPTEKYQVQVALPELSQLKCTASPLDYGTDYTFTLKASEPVKLSYFKDGEAKASRTAEMNDSLTAHAVLVAADRAQTPHYFEITDEDSGAVFLLYLTPDKGPAYARLNRSKQKLKIIRSK